MLTHLGKQYQLRRQRLVQVAGGSAAEEPPLSWNDIRISRLLDSGISGALAGGILNTWKRRFLWSRRVSISPRYVGGRSRLVPGLSTGALMCTLLQWASNEIDIMRIGYVSKNPVSPQPMTIGVKETIGPPRIGASLPPLPHSTPVKTSEVNTLRDRVFSFFGRRVSDEDYLRRLRLQRDSYLHRIAELEKELHGEQKS